MREISVLFIGDIIGRGGRITVKHLLSRLKHEHAVDLTIANGENAAAGVGITRKVYDELLAMGIDVITSGNHVWDQREFIKQIGDCPQFVRPANLPPAAPGKGFIMVEVHDLVKVGVINLSGRVFLPPSDDPFRTGEAVLAELKRETNAIIIDMHGEATSEKSALGWYFDGKISAVIGSHTHVQTADEKILPQGTAYITDVGMVGALNSIIGVETEPILERFLVGLPKKFKPEKRGPMIFNAVALKIDVKTGRAVSIKRIFETVPEEGLIVQQETSREKD